MSVVDRIKFDSPSDAVLVWKYPKQDLRLGSQLIVNEAQEALFVKRGQALDLFGPGTHTLSTQNVPLLQKLVSLPFGGDTPFAAEVWFVNKTAKRDLLWGTKSPIPVVDPRYNFPVSVRAFGQWGIRIQDSRSFVTQIVGTLSSATSEKVENYFSGEIVQRLSDALARFFVEKGVSVFEANAKLNELSDFTRNDLAGEFHRFGIEVVNFNVDRISIPKEEQQKFQEVLGKRMEIEQISQAKVGDSYRTMRTFDTLDKAAEAEGGAAGNLLAGGLGLGLGLGAGAPAGRELGRAMTPGEPASAADDPAERLRKLKSLLDEGLISAEEFEKKKQDILKSM